GHFPFVLGRPGRATAPVGPPSGMNAQRVTPRALASASTKGHAGTYQNPPTPLHSIIAGCLRAAGVLAPSGSGYLPGKAKADVERELSTPGPTGEAMLRTNRVLGPR